MVWWRFWQDNWIISKLDNFYLKSTDWKFIHTITRRTKIFKKKLNQNKELIHLMLSLVPHPTLKSNEKKSSTDWKIWQMWLQVLIIMGLNFLLSEKVIIKLKWKIIWNKSSVYKLFIKRKSWKLYGIIIDKEWRQFSL